ncbi:hypothetical protein [Shewanella sp. GXUN23E]|uniref:hypothetical protein n=1 Tax=Shewanella sp. GXUN23E TaxID=3422498 RepID=UPI003D7E1CF3
MKLFRILTIILLGFSQLPSMALATPQRCFTMPAEPVNTLISFANQDDKGACILLKDAMKYRVYVAYVPLPNDLQDAAKLKYTAGKHWSEIVPLTRENSLLSITDEIGNVEQLTLILYPDEQQVAKHIQVLAGYDPTEELFVLSLSMWTSRPEDPKAPFAL